jgi:hypothetical protein
MVGGPVNTTLLSVLGASTLVLLATGCETKHHARISDGAGLVPGSPVVVSGVRVGEVRSVRLIEGQVDVELVIDDEHELTLRNDSCAMARRGDTGPSLVIIPGVGEPLPEANDERPIPECDLQAEGMRDLLRSLGEGVGDMMRSLADGVLGGAAGSGGGGGGAPSGGGFPFPFPPAAPAPGGGTAPPLAPAPPPPGQPIQPPPPFVGSTGCTQLRVRVDHVEPANAVPLVLPNGGHRVHLVFSNDGDRTMRVGPVDMATFVDDAGGALHAANIPSETEGWFMPFDVPAHAFASRTVVFGASTAPRLDRLEARNTAPADQPLERCTFEARGLAPR